LVFVLEKFFVFCFFIARFLFGGKKKEET